MSDPDTPPSGPILRPVRPKRAERPTPPRVAQPDRAKRPPPPPPPGPGPTDPRALARQLFTALKRGKPLDFTPFASGKLREIEAALVVELDAGEIKEHGYRLRNLIRFTLAERDGLVAPLKPAGFSVSARGKVKEPAVTLRKLGKDSLGTVRMELGAVLRGKDAGDAFLLTFVGDTAGVHWLQFMWRRIVAHYPAAKGRKPKEVSLQSRYTFGSKLPKPEDRSPRVVVYSDDPKRPRWSTDGLVAESPFYEGRNAVRREPKLLELADSPGPDDHVVKSLFDAPMPPSKCVSTFEAVAYLVRGSEVFYRAQLTRHWDITRSGASVKAVGEPWKGDGGKLADKLDSEHRRALALQFPRWDYFPGDRIGPPVPRPSFQPIPATHPDFVKWPAGLPPDRLSAAAKIANAKLIEDVDEDPMTGVLTIHDGKKGPGLSYFAPLRGKSTNPVSGEAGFVDQSGKYHNPVLPHVRDEALPRVAMLLGEDAFQWGTAPVGGNMPNPRDKLHALAAMRHEMLHAVHNRIAVEWLLKWRDEMAKADFSTWFGKAARNELEKALVLTGLPTTAPTEILAYTEGFVTALPFLVPYPGAAALENKALWPASIVELDGLFRKMNALISKPSGLLAAQNRRLHEVVCEILDDAQRTVLVQWMDELATVDPRTANAQEKDSAKQLHASFHRNKQFLLDLKKMAQRC